MQDEYKRGYYRGIGEFHISGKAAAEPNGSSRSSISRSSTISICTPMATTKRCRILLRAQSEGADHLGAYRLSTLARAGARIADKYPELWGELSYRGGIIDGGGKLTAEWRALFERYPDRFLLGSDTWINERWQGYGEIMAGYRAGSVQLPPAIAAQIAHGNARALFGAE